MKYLQEYSEMQDFLLTWYELVSGVSMVYKLTGIRFQGMFEGFIHRHRRNALPNSRTAPLNKIF